MISQKRSWLRRSSKLRRPHCQNREFSFFIRAEPLECKAKMEVCILKDYSWDKSFNTPFSRCFRTCTDIVGFSDTIDRLCCEIACLFEREAVNSIQKSQLDCKLLLLISLVLLRLLYITIPKITSRQISVHNHVKDHSSLLYRFKESKQSHYF